MEKIRLAAPLQTDSVVDGRGLRMVVWTQGCPHHCPGCHNTMSHSYEGGTLYDIEELCQKITEFNYHDGITLSGGEPFEQVEACLKVASTAKAQGLNVWCYTGYQWETLLSKDDATLNMFLRCIDVLVDGVYMEELRSLDLTFRGSSNQRCIDVQKTLETGLINTIY